ncbi:MAG: hypothetical protein IJ600_12990 [Lachnospiraceae bacterium]|nr:hypothetical protein [Lachnospiraceae bacterium]
MTVGDFLGGGHTLSVNTDVLITKANEVEDKVKEMRTQFDQMTALIDGTRNYWIGEAGDMHRNLYNGHKEDIEKKLQDLEAHPVNLREVANRVYGGLVSEIKETVEALPGDAIS